jgi:putative nucleotidyltransferase with HDIG domain
MKKHESKLQDLKNAYVGILEILAKYLESTDRYTKGHSVRVAELAMETAIAMELLRSEVETIRVAGLLHDIGKIGVPKEILNKAGKLTPEEWEVIRFHPIYGAEIIMRMKEKNKVKNKHREKVSQLPNNGLMSHCVHLRNV